MVGDGGERSDLYEATRRTRYPIFILGTRHKTPSNRDLEGTWKIRHEKEKFGYARGLWDDIGVHGSPGVGSSVVSPLKVYKYIS